MATQKQLRFLYQAKNNATGLTDVKAQVYLNGVAKAVNGSSIVGTELDATNSPGVYEIILTAAMLTAYGVVAGSYAALEVKVDSATKSAETIFRQELTVANIDDIDTKIGSPVGASVSADIAAVKSDTAAIKVDLESGTSSLATILAAINQIKANAGFAVPVPATLVKPASGSNTYRIPVTLYNESNALVDADTNSIAVSLVNQSGADRSSYLTGASGTSAPMVRDSLGQYHIDIAIPSTAAQEELLFNFAYSIGSVATARRTVTEIITDVNADGFALQTTLVATQTTVNAINALITDPTNGLANIESQISNGTYGLSALQTLSTAIQSLLTNGTYGLSAINTAVGAVNTTLANATYGLSALQVQGAASQGTGFVSSTDSLHAISLYLSANVYSGGRAV
jgi:hypothetical protein